MRAWLFHAFLRRYGKRIPSWLSRAELQILCHMTARAFGVKGRWIFPLSAREALWAYTAFTLECMKNPPEDLEKIGQVARQMGEKVRRLSGLKTREDRRELVFALYRGIAISMEGELPGQVRVTGCSFSKSYTPAQCLLMSRIDEGIICSIMGGEKLVFTERITEGCPACLARLW